MMLAWALIGFAAGSLINRAADRWPHLGSQQPGHRWFGVAIMLSATFAFVWLYSASGPLEQRLPLAAALCFLLLIAAIDLKHRIIPNVLLGPAAIIVLLFHAVPPRGQTLGALLGGVVGLAPFLLVALLRPGSLGGGDIKLAALIGLCAGFPLVLWPVSLGIIVGGVTSIALIITRRGERGSQLPYAPFLCLGAIVALFYNPLSTLLRK